MSMIFSCVFTNASSLALTSLNTPFSFVLRLIQLSIFGGKSEKLSSSNLSEKSLDISFDSPVVTPDTRKDAISRQICLGTIGSVTDAISSSRCWLCNLDSGTTSCQRVLSGSVRPAPTRTVSIRTDPTRSELSRLSRIRPSVGMRISTTRSPRTPDYNKILSIVLPFVYLILLWYYVFCIVRIV